MVVRLMRREGTEAVCSVFAYWPRRIPMTTKNAATYSGRRFRYLR